MYSFVRSRSPGMLKVESAIGTLLQGKDLVQSIVVIADFFRSHSNPPPSKEYAVLMDMAEYGPVSTTLLMELGYSPIVAHKALKKLEKDGLIERMGQHVQHSSNGRYYRTHIYQIKEN